jgi:iron complex outermembrane receptor protein
MWIPLWVVLTAAGRQPAVAASAPPPGDGGAAPATEGGAAAGQDDRRGGQTPGAEGLVERVRVEAPADREPLLDATSFSTVLLREDLDRRMLSLTEALRESAGVQVRAFGGLGDFATVSIRGSTSEQVEVYLDGVPQRPALGGGVNLGDLPSLALERVEVYRGFTPASLGPASLAGAVSLRTRSPAQPATDLRLSYGSFATARLGALSARRAGGWDILGSLEAARSQGDFEFFGAGGLERRENNGFRTLQLLGRAQRPLADRAHKARLEIYNTLLVRNQGVPGFQTQPSPDAAYTLFRDTLQAGAALASPWGGWNLDPALYAILEHQGYENLTRSPATDEENRLSTLGARAPLVLRPGSSLRWTLAPEIRQERAERRDSELSPAKRFEARRDGVFISTGAEWETAAGRLLVAPALRWTALASSFDGLDLGVPVRSSRSQQATSGKIGVRWGIAEGLALKANAGSFFREPSLSELYGNSGLIQGSPGLSEERGRHADLGLSWSWAAAGASASNAAPASTQARRVRPRRGVAGRAWIRDAHLEGSAFLTRADNLILLFPTGGGTVKPQNSGRAQVTGLELTGTLGAAGGWSFDLAFTHQRAVDTSGLFGLEGKILPGRPVQELHAGAHLERGRWRYLYRFSFIGDNYTDRLNTRRVPDRYLHALGVRFAPRHAWGLALEAENLADQRVGDLAGYPLPGRMVTARIEYRP